MALHALMIFQTNLNAQSMYEKIEPICQSLYSPYAPGAAVIVIKDGIQVMNDGFGMTNLRSQKKITPDTHFRIASVSKQFTAMCILLLQAQGKIRVDQPARKYLPTLPAFAGTITIQQLMNHTSGIADYEALIPRDQSQQVSDADVLKLVSNSDGLYFEPGSAFRYSNTAFCLLTQIVEKVSGMSYPKFIERYLFEPSQMSTSTIYDESEEITERAYGYHQIDGTWVPADQSLTSATMGDGSVYTSVNEYQKWIKVLWGIGSSELYGLNIAEATSSGRVAVKNGLSYSNGWFIATETDGSTVFFHSGESTGFHNIVFHNPSKKTLIAIFSNSDDDRVSQAFDKISNTLRVKVEAVPEGTSLFDFLSKIYGD